MRLKTNSNSALGFFIIEIFQVKLKKVTFEALFPSWLASQDKLEAIGLEDHVDFFFPISTPPLDCGMEPIYVYDTLPFETNSVLDFVIEVVSSA